MTTTAHTRRSPYDHAFSTLDTGRAFTVPLLRADGMVPRRRLPGVCLARRRPGHPLVHNPTSAEHVLLTVEEPKGLQPDFVKGLGTRGRARGQQPTLVARGPPSFFPARRAG